MKTRLTKITTKAFTAIKTSPRLQPVFYAIKEKIPLVQEFWAKLTEREKLLVGVMGAGVVTFILVSCLSAAITLVGNLQLTATELKADNIQARSMSKIYNSLLKISGNEFSQVKLSRVKEDITQILNNKNPDAIMQDNILTIKVDNVIFESSILFVDQMRKSYGLFPETLVIMTAFNPGYVNFKATFRVENNE
jgi:type II secretory pathway component PulM